MNLYYVKKHKKNPRGPRIEGRAQASIQGNVELMLPCRWSCIELMLLGYRQSPIYHCSNEVDFKYIMFP